MAIGKEVTMGKTARRDRLVALLAPVVEAEGLDLEDVTVTPAGKRRLVRVVVDRDGGISLDDVSEVSRSVSEKLDASDALGNSPYVLEVTSPGVDRPLTEPRHWRRARGEAGEGGADRRHRSRGPDRRGRRRRCPDRGRRPFRVRGSGKGKVQVEFRHLDDEDEDEDDIADGDEG